MNKPMRITTNDGVTKIESENCAVTIQETTEHGKLEYKAEGIGRPRFYYTVKDAINSAKARITVYENSELRRK